MSPCSSSNEFGGAGSGTLTDALGPWFFAFRVIGGESGMIGRGSRGIGGGTGTGGGGVEGNDRGNRYTSMPNCFFTALKSAFALAISVESMILDPLKEILTLRPTKGRFEGVQSGYT